MGDKTKIEWTDATWSPTRGCSRVSTGCEHCYAESIAARFSGPGLAYEGLARIVTREKLLSRTLKDGTSRTRSVTSSMPQWTGRVNLIPDQLKKPLHWRKPKKIFVCSTSDLFHESLRDDEIDQVFGVMWACLYLGRGENCWPGHTFQILTKRPERMLAYMTAKGRQEAWARQAGQHGGEEDALFEQTIAHRGPHPRIWLGASVENQDAVKRVRPLLDTPAAVRFLSCEPLLGPVNLAAALRRPLHMRIEDCPATWAEFSWPEWVPMSIRVGVEEFWGCCGRSPRNWLTNILEMGAPPFGEIVQLRELCGGQIEGRFVHAWNNIGRIVMADGQVKCVSFDSPGYYPGVVKNGRGLDWIIAGGESGPGARVMQTDWAHSLRNQCVAQDVPFFFKQGSKDWDAPKDFASFPADLQVREFPKVAP